MKRRFTEEQIIRILGEQEGGAAVRGDHAASRDFGAVPRGGRASVIGNELQNNSCRNGRRDGKSRLGRNRVNGGRL